MVNLAVSFIAAFAGLLFHLKQLQILDAPADERIMEQLLKEGPQDGCGIKCPAERASGLTSSVAAHSRALCGSEEPPRRVTPTEARAKLLRSLIVQPVPPTNEADQKKLAELQLRFLRELASQP